MKPETIKKLLKLNQNLYEKRALSWSKTRQELWEKPVLDFIDTIPKNSNVLDLGCGNARLYKQLTKKNINYTGIDSSKSLIKLNKQKYPKAKFKIGDGLNIDYKNQFDYIFCLAVLHHIPSEKLQLKFLKNIYRSLKPNGFLILSVWSRWQNKYRKYFDQKKLFSDMQKKDLIIPWKQTKYMRYVYAFDKKEFFDLTNKTGFNNINIFYANKSKKCTKKDALNIYLICQK